MPDELEGVNSPNPAVESPPAEGSAAPAGTPPTEENSGQPGSQRENLIPQSRFNEVVAERNELRKSIAGIESRLEAQERLVQGTPEDQMVRYLTENGMEADAAKVFAKANATYVQSVMKKEQPAPAPQGSQPSSGSMVDQFASQHSDYAAVEPKMREMYAKMSDAEKDLVAANPQALEKLYADAKLAIAEQRSGSAFEDGRKAGIEGRQMKAAVSPDRGAAGNANNLPTLKQIQDMPIEEYQEKQKFIHDNMDEIIKISKGG